MDSSEEVKRSQAVIRTQCAMYIFVILYCRIVYTTHVQTVVHDTLTEDVIMVITETATQTTEATTRGSMFETTPTSSCSATTCYLCLNVHLYMLCEARRPLGG